MLKFFDPEDSPLTQLFFFGLVGFLLLATHFSFFLPYMGVLLILSLLQKGFHYYTKAPSSALSMFQFWILLCALALGWTALVDFPHLTHVWRLVFKGFSPSFGMTHDVVNPFYLMLMLMASMKPTEVYKLLEYGFLFMGIGALLFHKFRKNTLTAPLFSLSVFFLGASALYLLYSWIGGGPTSSWAFAAAVLYPLSFLFLALIFSDSQMQKRSTLVPPLVLGALGISYLVQTASIRNQTFLSLKEYAPLSTLKTLVADPQVKEITLDLGEDSLGTAIAPQFCPSKFIIVLSRKAYDWSKVFPQMGVLCRASPLFFNQPILSLWGSPFAGFRSLPFWR